MKDSETMKPEAFIGSEAFRGQLAVKVRPEKVDTFDRKILYVLSLNARISNTTIAKHLKLSREIVAYRIKRLQELDVLHGFSTLVNAQKVGKSVHTVGIKLHTTVRTEEVLAELQKMPVVTKITHCGGMYDLLLNIMGNTLHNNYDSFQQILAKHGQKIRHHQLFPKLEQDFCGLKMLVENPKERAYLERIQERKGSAFQAEFSQQEKSTISAAIDQVDTLILDTVKHNARLPLSELSFQTGISLFQLNQRLARMIRQGIIQRFIPYLALAHIGLQFNVVFLNVRKDAELKFCRWVEEHPHIVWRTKFLGSHNYKLSIFVRNNAYLSDILNELCTEFGEEVSHIESLPVFRSPQYSSLA